MFESIKSQHEGAFYMPVSACLDEHPGSDGNRFKSRRRSSPFLHITVLGSVLLNIVLAVFLVYQYIQGGPNNPIFPQTLYSPAQRILQYQIKKFSNGFRDETTIYQGPPSPEVDEAWESLYSFKYPEATLLLPNKTAALPNDNAHYIIELDVFHELHCLNMIRQALRPEYYKPMMIGADGEDELFGYTHLDHCVDSIRQSLMCSADISPLVWQWKEEYHETKIRADIAHTCRDFDKIRDWAMQNQLKGEFDTKIHVEEDVSIAGF